MKTFKIFQSVEIYIIEFNLLSSLLVEVLERDGEVHRVRDGDGCSPLILGLQRQWRHLTIPGGRFIN